MNLVARSSVSAAVSIGLGALAAALTPVAIAPPAHADDFTDVINAVDADFAAGQAEFALANGDFGSSDFPDGLANFLSGADDYLVGGPDNFLAGTAELISGQPVESSFVFGLDVPPDLATVYGTLTDYMSLVQADLGYAAMDFTTGNFADGVSNSLAALDYFFVLPPEELLLGAVAGFGI
jgi:hypothetical protein